MAKKIKETYLTPPQGLSGVQYTYTRVREIPDDQEVPQDAVLLPPDDVSLVSEWVKQESK